MKKPKRYAVRYHPACHPLMAKGGVHKKVKSAVRRVSRDIVEDELDDYLQSVEQKADQNDPPFLIYN